MIHKLYSVWYQIITVAMHLILICRPIEISWLYVFFIQNNSNNYSLKALTEHFKKIDDNQSNSFSYKYQAYPLP